MRPAALLAAPVIDMLAVHDGPSWLAGLWRARRASARSPPPSPSLITIGLFRIVGPKRTRLIAQIVAAIIGAGFVIGIQAAAILSYGTMNRFAVLQSADVVAPCTGSRQPRCGPRPRRHGRLAGALPSSLPSASARWRRHRLRAGELRPPCHRRRRHRPAAQCSSARAAASGRAAEAGTAPQGMDAAAPRPLAAVADPDADPLSAAAGAAAVDQFRPERRCRGGRGARAGDGGRPARRAASPGWPFPARTRTTSSLPPRSHRARCSGQDRGRGDGRPRGRSRRSSS